MVSRCFWEYWQWGESETVSPLVASDPINCNSPRFLCPWNSPDMKTGMGCHSLLRGIFLTQRWNPGLLHCRQILYYLSHQGSPVASSSIRQVGLLSVLLAQLRNTCFLNETVSSHILRKGPQRYSLRKTSHRTREHPKATPTQALPTGRFSHRHPVSCSS